MRDYLLNMSNPLINLLDYDREALCQLLISWGETPYRGKQLFQAIHQQGITDISEITTLSKAFREKLREKTAFQWPSIIKEQRSKDGTCKWILSLADSNCIETVFIPEATRGTLCISSQVGCALNCQFCSTGQQGFNRNLTRAEIISQLWIAKQRLQIHYPGQQRIISNVVFMGMGEPLLNLNPVIASTRMMLDDLGYGLSKYRVTVSTSGIVPAMQRLKDETEVSLAISLHAANDELRNKLVLINRKYPLSSLMQACRNFFPPDSRHVVMFEYVMLHGINDSLAQAKQLSRLLSTLPCKLNLIPFNPFPGASYTCSTPQAIEQFKQLLTQKGIHTTVRKTRGDDIDAACGQLVGNVLQRKGTAPIRIPVDQITNIEST